MQQRPLFRYTGPRNVPVQPSAPSTETRIYSVSELNSESKTLLESNFPSIWVEGEISNFTQPASGHFYFSLKDEQSQLNAVMWRSSHRHIRWRPKNGMKVIACGRLTLYEPRGNYQLDVGQLVPHGKGDLFAAFEQLKEKLKAEGLFDPKRKRPIPVFPRKIGIVTSPTGAVIRDILQVLGRRYMNLHMLVFPAKVQGEEAAPEIVRGIRVLNSFTDIDVLILARGGGSIEDLWPFNEERVARAIVASRIPVISAVGHETDTTIADFVADLRAPTPSAAAELVIGKKSEFVEKLMGLHSRMDASLQRRILQWKKNVESLVQHRALTRIPQKIQTHQQTIDEYELRLRKGLSLYHQIQNRRLLAAQHNLSPGQLRHLIEVKRSSLNQSLSRLRNRMTTMIQAGHKQLAWNAGKLDSLSPLSVLERGYSITTDETGNILKESRSVESGDQVIVRLQRGRLKCEIKETHHE